MNKTNMLRVADAIEAENKTFQMNTWFDDSRGDRMRDHSYDIRKIADGESMTSCGTVACVGGWANVLEIRDTQTIFDPLWDGSERATRFLELSEDEARDLFMGIGAPGNWHWMNDNRKLVPDALRYMAETGEIDWSEGFKYAECVEREK